MFQRLEDRMRRFMFFVGMGTALIAAGCSRAVPTRPLAQAAARNDLDAVRTLMAARHALDERDDNGLTPLMWAAREGAVAVLTALLDAGANVDARDARHEWTALQHAVHTQQADAVRVLLDRGADPNAKAHPHALTPLLMAAGDRDPAIVKLLLARGADPRHQGEWGDTPLARAVSGGPLMDIDRPLLGGCRAETVRALLAQDSTLDLPDNVAGRLALMWARVHVAAEHDPGERCAGVLQLLNRGKRLL
jgi:ankyrin repeat protein